MNPLIDATEMYLRTVYELQEEGITPIRARLVERLGLSAPAVSETVGRLEAEGLMVVAQDRTRTLSLTDRGRTYARSVMRKHRLAERLLTDVIGLEWEQVHVEACKWEHVISDRVEERLIDLLSSPTSDPHGNPIPGIGPEADEVEVVTVAEAAKAGGPAVVERISERLQVDVACMRMLAFHGLLPGATTELAVVDGRVVARGIDGERVELPDAAAELVYVRRP